MHNCTIRYTFHFCWFKNEEKNLIPINKFNFKYNWKKIIIFLVLLKLIKYFKKFVVASHLKSINIVHYNLTLFP